MKKSLLLVLTLTLLLATACGSRYSRSRHYGRSTPEDRSGGPAAETDEAMEEMGRAARDMGRSMKEGVEDMGRAIEDGARDMGRAVRDADRSGKESAEAAGVSRAPDRPQDDDRVPYSRKAGPGGPFREMLDAARFDVP